MQAILFLFLKRGCSLRTRTLLLLCTSGIWDLAKSMRLRSCVAAAATTYFRRFYTRANFCAWDPQLVHVGCLYLASKAEECSVAASLLVRWPVACG
jgi:cyclin C